MSAPYDTVLAYWRYHREQFRQSKNQHAVLTNYVLMITAAINGFIVQQNAATTPHDRPPVAGISHRPALMTLIDRRASRW